MDLMKECANRIKNDPDRIEPLKKAVDLKDRVKILDEIMARLNISKRQLKEFSSEEITRLFYCLQKTGVVMGLCQYFRTFFSNRNRAYHQICEATPEKIRTYCKGNISRCSNDFFDLKGNPKKGLAKIKKRRWDQV